jgi:hypothetical protein
MKKLLSILILSLLLGESSFAGEKYKNSNEKYWIDTLEEAELCASTDVCDVHFNELEKQPLLWIGKSYFDPKEPENIAYDGEYIPNKIVGYIGEDWQSFGFPGIDEHNSTPFKTKSGIKMRNTSITWTEELDRLVVPTDGDDGGTIPKNDEKIYDGGEVATHRHTIKIAHAIQYGLAGSNTALVKLKDALVEGAKGNYLTTMKPANFFYTQGEGHLDYPGFSNTLQKFQRVILPIIEAHIILQRKNIYDEAEFDLVHGWLQKRVWGIEHGVMDGTIAKNWKWKPAQDPLDHETVKKRLIYLLWGIADQNKEYFTAGVNGFKDAYSIVRKNGSLKTEHRTGKGGNFGINTGNYVIQTIVNMAIILNNQGYDIKKEYPKIDKMVKFTSKLVENPTKSKYFRKNPKLQDAFNHSLEFIEDPKPWNTLAYVLIYDKVFNTKYSADFPDTDEANSLPVMGIADARELLINNNHFKSINHKYEDQQPPWKPNGSDSSEWNWFVAEKNQ